MALLKCTKKAIDYLDYNEVASLGYNMLEDSNYSIINRETGNTPKMMLNLEYDENALIGLVGNKNLPFHVDIMCNSVDITFDMKKERKIEKLLFTSFFNASKNYTVDEFAIFASNSKDDLFCDGNIIIHEAGGKDWLPGERNNADWLYDVEGSCRYLGVRIYKANATDKIIRPETFGVYNAEYTKKRTYITENFEKNILSGIEPANITDGIAFEDDSLYTLKAEETLTLEVENFKTIDKVQIITKGESKLMLGNYQAECEPIIYGRYLYTFDNLEIGKELRIKASETALIDYICANSKTKEAEIDFDDTIVDDFLSLGANVLPMAFMPESLGTGYNEVYWELDRRRILLVRPNVVRIWFQPDWLVENYEQYKNGDYNFDAPKMYSVYKYLDAFKEAGSEIEFNFGWKVSSFAQDWFSFPETDLRRNSAPKDLELFAKCCGATLNELINQRGYDNIKYLTFYNEPDEKDNPIDKGDFIVVGCDRKVYWERMMRLSKAEIDKYNLSDLKIWGCEVSHANNMQKEWIEYFEENCADILNMHTSHRYVLNTKKNRSYLNTLKGSAKTKPIMITEFGQCYSNGEYSFDLNHVQFFCELVNAGISGALIWCLNSVDITDPCSFSMRNFIDMWDSLQYPHAIDNVREVYYELAMLCRYIPKHCKSVRSKIIYGDDMKICAFKIGEDDYTVVVELNSESNQRDIQLNFDRNIGKKMYRHIYKRPYSRNGNAILPPVSAEKYATDT